MTTVAEEFLDLAGWATETSPLYERLCRAVAADEDLRAIAAHGPAGISRANVFMAAVQYLLLRDADGDLAAYYPSVAADPRPIDAGLEDAFRTFCLSHEDDIVSLVDTRRTQTNAVRRCAALYPAFATVAERVDGPIAVIELGPSAGLNLLWDRYRYDYDGRVVGTAGSPVTVRTTLRGAGEPPLPTDPPAVHSRVGVDLNPMDPTDDEDADWLRALVWPEHHDRRRVLDGAIEVAREDPPRVVEGDMVEELPALVDDVPADVPVVVYSTLVLYQVPERVRRDLRELVGDLATERSLHWLSGDDEYGESEGITLEWTRDVGGESRTDLLGVFQQHGEWLDWRYDGERSRSGR